MSLNGGMSRMMNRAAGRMPLRDRMVESIGRDFSAFGDIDFHPFTVPHDAVDKLWIPPRTKGVRIATLMDFVKSRPWLRTTSWLRGDRDRIKSQPRHAQDSGELPLGIEASGFCRASVICRMKTWLSGCSTVLTARRGTLFCAPVAACEQSYLAKITARALCRSARHCSQRYRDHAFIS